ncbi:MAG: hypothetical protein B7Y83_00190 [Flavobacteriales bacterium 32-34-25]|nr:MAG: hypothetical protein B7Y83_00190 [Flavobacteriales bacterium 32-34-25]
MEKKVVIVGIGNALKNIPVDLIPREIHVVKYPLRFEDNPPEVLEDIKRSWLEHCSNDNADVYGKSPLIKFVISEIEKKIENEKYHD